MKNELSSFTFFNMKQENVSLHFREMKSLWEDKNETKRKEMVVIYSLLSRSSRFMLFLHHDDDKNYNTLRANF